MWNKQPYFKQHILNIISWLWNALAASFARHDETTFIKIFFSLFLVLVVVVVVVVVVALVNMSGNVQLTLL